MTVSITRHKKHRENLQTVTNASMNYIAQMVRKARSKAGMTQEDVARAIGQRTENYNKLETGKRPFKSPLLSKVAKVVGLSIPLSNPEAVEILAQYTPQAIRDAVKIMEKHPV